MIQSRRVANALPVAAAVVVVLALMIYAVRIINAPPRVTMVTTSAIWRPQKGGISEIVWSRDTGLAAITMCSGRQDRYLEVVDTSTGKCVAPVRHMDSDYQPMCFSPDGSVLAIFSHRLPGVLLWDIRKARPLWSSPMRPASMEGETAAYSADGRYLAVRHHGTLSALDLKSRGTMWNADIIPGWSIVEGRRDVVFVPDGRGVVITSSADTAHRRMAGRPTISLEERSLTTGRFIRHIATVGRPMHCIALSPDGTLMSANSDTELLLIRTDTLAVVARIDWSGVVSQLRRIDSTLWPRVQGVAFSPDSRLVAFTVSDGSGLVCVYSIPEKRIKYVMRSTTEDICPYDIEFAGDGRSLLTIGNHALYRWTLP